MNGFGISRSRFNAQEPLLSTPPGRDGAWSEGTARMRRRLLRLVLAACLAALLPRRGSKSSQRALRESREAWVPGAGWPSAAALLCGILDSCQRQRAGAGPECLQHRQMGWLLFGHLPRLQGGTGLEWLSVTKCGSGGFTWDPRWHVPPEQRRLGRLCHREGQGHA